jgi:hypothetical protein
VDSIPPIRDVDRTVPAVELTHLTPVEREQEKQRRERERRRRKPPAEPRQSGDDGPFSGIDVRV